MSRHIAHEEEQSGLTLRIVLDDGGTDSPLSWDNGVLMAVLHRNYINPADETKQAHGFDLTSPEGIAEFEAANAGADALWAVFELYMYDHSGTAYRPSRGGNPFSCPWDSGRVGIVALKRADFGEGDLFKSAESVCDEYTSWANGEIFGFEIEDEDGNHVDSCWGFIGASDGYVLDQGREMLTHFAAKKDADEKEMAAEGVTE